MRIKKTIQLIVIHFMSCFQQKFCIWLAFHGNVEFYASLLLAKPVAIYYIHNTLRLFFITLIV